MDIRLDNRLIGLRHPTYFIADIAANHDGSLDRAVMLIAAAKEAGADAAKFQHFKADQIVSDVGFGRMDRKLSHQSAWRKDVSQVYREASVPDGWTPKLKSACDKVGITFLSSPYDFGAVDMLDPYVPAFKIGSGDIDWLEEIEYIARKKKPVILGTGAATIGEIQQAVSLLRNFTDQVILLQCNTNYTASEANYDYLNLNVLKTYATIWPDVVLGLSDHTQSLAPVLGAVTLGARVIERHFTDDNRREGPDHSFALDPPSWAQMVQETRRLERALGSTQKDIAENEMDTAVVQRRCLRASRDLRSGEKLTRRDVVVLRPALPQAIKPNELASVVGRTLTIDVKSGEELQWTFLEA